MTRPAHPRWTHTIALLLLSVALAGCGGPGADSSDATETDEGSIGGAPVQIRIPRGETAVEDEPATARESGSAWRATRDIKLTNGVGDAERIHVEIDSAHGPIILAGLDDGTVEATVTVFARSESESEATTVADAVTLNRTDELVDGTLHVRIEVESLGDDPAAAGATVSIAVPSWIPVDAILSNRAGATSSLNVNGGLLTVTNEQGPILVRGGWASMDLTTTESIIDAEARPSEGAGSYKVRGTSTAVGLRVNATGAGLVPAYDAMGTTADSMVTLDLPGAEPVGEGTPTFQHHRTPGFESASDRLSIDVETTSGQVFISAASTTASPRHL